VFCTRAGARPHLNRIPDAASWLHAGTVVGRAGVVLALVFVITRSSRKFDVGARRSGTSCK